MSTQNLSLTAGEAFSINFADANAATTDKVYAVFYDRGGAFLTKKSVEFGGSTAEINIVADTRYELKGTIGDSQKIPDGSTYNMYKVDEDDEPELIFNGDVEVTGASVVAAPEIQSATQIFVTQKFSANENFEQQVPPGWMIDEII